MTDADRSVFAGALHMLAETFNESISDLRAEGYFQALIDLPLEVVKVAIFAAMRDRTFFPRPVELRKLVEGDPEAQADAAWSALMREIHRAGYIGTPTFEDPQVLRAIVDVWGSWSRLCQTLPGEGPELVGWIKQFKGAYRSAGVRADHDRLLGDCPPDVRKTLERLALEKAMPGTPQRADVAVDAMDRLRTLRKVAG